MKRIIRGKLYDTDKAKEVGSWQNMQDVRNLHHFTESLFQKRTGEFFLHGQGGPMTQYAEAIGQNSWKGGERIMPMSYEEARAWAEEHLDADKYGEVFGLPAEDAGDVALHVKIPADLDARVRALASARGLSLAALVIEALREAAK